jgi:holo-[acyl-carrier protein] synthase
MLEASVAPAGLSVGIDIVEIEVVARLFTRHRARFLELVYTPAEQRYCGGRASNLAGVFAAKEAAAKALGTGLAYMATGGVGLHELEIVGDGGARPRIYLHGSAQSRAEALGLRAWTVSFAYSRKAAVALVIAS